MRRPRSPVRAEELHTVAEVCAYLKVSATTVYGLVSAGTIASSRVGGQIRVSREALLAYTHRQHVPPVRPGRKTIMTSDQPIDLNSAWRKTDEAMRRRKGVAQNAHA